MKEKVFTKQVKGNNPGLRVSKVIAGWIEKEADKGLMLPRKPEEIASKLSAGMAVVAFNGRSEPVGYCELMNWPQSVMEIGGLVVEPEARRQGIGSSLVKGAIEVARQEFPEARVFCLAENEASEILFKKLGGTTITKDSLPEAVWSICPNCVHYSKFPDECPCKAMNLEGVL